VKYACSEEVPEPVDLQGSGFSVAFDPLDGSSIVDTNFTVGTIFGVWPGDKLKGITGRDQAWPRPHAYWAFRVAGAGRALPGNMLKWHRRPRAAKRGPARILFVFRGWKAGARLAAQQCLHA
jgi:hypothetical protein